MKGDISSMVFGRRMESDAKLGFLFWYIYCTPLLVCSYVLWHMLTRSADVRILW